MIRVSDLAAGGAWALAPRSTARAETSASAWFDADGPRESTSIVGDPSLSARGLSVDQHAARVLEHLRGDPDPV